MIRIRTPYLLCFFILLLAAAPIGRAQVSTGRTPFSSVGGGQGDQIDLGNLDVHIEVPVVSKPGRGMGFHYSMSFDSSVWYPVGTTGSQNWQPVTNWGWRAQTEAAVGYVSYSSATYHGTIIGPPLQHCTSTKLFHYVYHDVFGIPHPFPAIFTGTCGDVGDNPFGLANDGSGITYDAGLDVVTTRLGQLVTPGLIKKTDANGNQITSNGTSYTDTLGTTVLTTSGTAPSPVNYTYTSPAGTQVSVQFNFTSYTVLTHFNCSGVSEYGPTTTPLVSSIVLPDGTSYAISYEPTPGTPGDVTGRITSIQLPTGGTITYTYTGGSNGIVCADGSTAGLTRQTPDGTWTYARSGSGSAWTTTVTDPSTAANQTVINFQVEPTGQNFYETERQVYQGSSTGTLLKTVFTCYNAHAPNCNSTAIALPITQQSVYVQWPGTNGLESRTDTLYDSNYGMVTTHKEYAYGPGAPGALVRTTLTTYASLTNGIVGRPATITVQDGSGNTKSQMTYTYDQGFVNATSGTPQHISISGSRGNPTAISYLVQGSTTLSKSFTYYDTGTVTKATDFNGAATNYTYGTSSCGNSFPTSVSEPLSLTRSMIWNCVGGVQTSITDENSKTTTATFSDPYFWRTNALTDANSNIANLTYTAATSAEASLVFGSSTSDVLATVDPLGRAHVSQRRQSPSSTTYDSVETDYDQLGRPSRTTLPYSATAGATNSTWASTLTAYDSLGRKTQVTDSGGRSVTFTYAQNDTYLTAGPAPTGENAKRKQFEYDALGRLSSVCEVTSATGSGGCAQSSAVVGYWTKYTYDTLGNLTGVTQNAQSTGSQQTRTYAYDDVRRITSETNPENGQTQYFYDTDPGTVGASCPGTYKGDLVKKYDAVGNTSCYTYDSLHRVTSTAYAGPYAANTLNRYFVYDSGTVNGVAMTNAKSHMIEAFTATCSTCTKKTDVGFSYTALGQISDAYQLTPNSGTYYHTTASYWPNGGVDQLSGITGLPTLTYSVDGEGRVNAVSAASGQNPLTSTTYNPASQPTQINLGSSDIDSFTYDPNTNRTTQYKFTVNGQSVTGTLTWNAIGSLKSLAVTDPFYGPGNQTCAYAHDDVARIASANCGSPWSQTFTYDAFGNLTKSGTVSFAPTYSWLTNRMTQIGSSTPTYDANGNVTNDFLHTYTWDANGRPITADGVGLTYDALGRMVEQNKGGVYYQIVYAPTGSKLAIMKGSVLQKGFAPLPGGSLAMYTSSGLTYYRHSDWLGSSRFASTPTRTMYYDGAYGPFGEPYAQTGTTDVSFTGMNQDTAANLYDFPAREYGTQGRWPSPDPAGVSSVRPDDPQSLNRYAYVRNNPLTAYDPTGMDDCWVGDSTCNGGGGSSGADPSGGGCDSGGCNPGPDPGTPDPCVGNPGLCDSGDPCMNPFSGGCSDPFGGSGPTGWGNGNLGGQNCIGGCGDPCVYSNEDGSYNVDTHTNATECTQKNADGTQDGVWVPDNGSTFGVDSNGDVTVYAPPKMTFCGKAGLVGGYLFVTGGAMTINSGGWGALLGMGGEVTAGPVVAGAGVLAGAVGLVCAFF